MAVRTFQAKLIVLMFAALVLLQAATLIAIRYAGEWTLRTSIREELGVASRVLDRQLANRGEQLTLGLRLLASDFAFREAIALGDEATIASVLANHGSRIGADAAFLISLDGDVEADTLGGRFTGERFPVPSLLRETESPLERSAIVSFEQRPYQIVVVPVLAPRAIAWVSMGFPIGPPLVEETRRLTSVEVSLWSQSPGERPVVISTLPPGRQADLFAKLTGRAPAAGEVIEIGSEEYATLVETLPTADDSVINTALQRSVAEARQPYRRLEAQIFILSTLALIAALIAALLFARGVSRPITQLAEGASRIERGDYSALPDVRQKDEIGRLASAFNRMRTAIAQREEQIRFQATHDSLTGLANRSLFLDRLRQAIANAQRRGSLVGMLMMDVDRFKEINDTLGHPFGDDLLNEIGRRLEHGVRDGDTVARLGGDEFAVMFEVGDRDEVDSVADRILSVFETPFSLASISIDVHASMGIALFPLHADDAETLMKKADIAMYQAKRHHSRFAVYEKGRDEHSLRRLAILSELRQAVEGDALELHYQPKIDIRTGRAVQAEALVRWRHPVHGVMPPDEFIPLAEQSGNIGMITRWVLRNAIRQCAEWEREGLGVAIAINISALDLYDLQFPALISGLLADAKLTPSSILLEITESAVMREPAHAIRVLSELKQRGIELAIDDYGTGYSSLAHLQALPVHQLKIDKSFIVNLAASGAADDVVIVRSTIELGHRMGLQVIAEGVENRESLALLRELGCDMAQGYYISTPLPATEFRRWIEEARQPAEARET